MKTIDELKQEQYDLKAKLHEIIEFTNSSEFFALPPREKSLIGQQRSGMEIYLSALTNRIYGQESFSFDISSAMWPMLFSSALSVASSNSPSSEASEDLQKIIDEEATKLKELEEEHEQ